METKKKYSYYKYLRKSLIYLTENISTDETFNAMMGFSESEVYEFFHYYQ